MHSGSTQILSHHLQHMAADGELGWCPNLKLVVKNWTVGTPKQCLPIWLQAAISTSCSDNIRPVVGKCIHPGSAPAAGRIPDAICGCIRLAMNSLSSLVLRFPLPSDVKCNAWGRTWQPSWVVTWSPIQGNLGWEWDYSLQPGSQAPRCEVEWWQ